MSRSPIQSINLGPMIHSSFGQGASFKYDADQRYSICFVSNGATAVFHEFDLFTGELLFRQEIPNTDCVWGICTAQSGDVYFSGVNDSTLYRYSSDGLRTLGSNPSGNWTWQLAERDGVITGGTYPNAKLYSYDIASETFTDHGIVKPGEDYVRGVGIDDKWYYAGIGSHKYIIRIDRESGEQSELVLDRISGEQGFVDRIWSIGEYLFVSCDYITMNVFHKETLQPIDSFPYDNMLAAADDYAPERLYYKYGDKLLYWDMEAQSSAATGIEGLPAGRCKAMQWIKMDGLPPTLGLVTVNAELALISMKDNKVSTRTLNITPKAIIITCLEAGTDDKLYLGGYQRGISIYNDQTKEIELSIGLFPQTEGLTFWDGVAYYGTYTHAHLYRFDPRRAVDFGQSPEHNPGWIGQIDYGQDRPFAMTSGDGLVFAGTVPDYGLQGGAIAVYDTATGALDTYPNIVEDQSILGLTYKDGLLYGGTSVWGGLGTAAAEGPARIFVWDVKARRKIAEFVPDIPNIDAAPLMIGDLSLGPDGLIWGAIDGTIFAMESLSYKVVKSKVVLPTLYQYSKWRPIYLRWGADGILYTSLGRRLIAIQPDTLEFQALNDDIVGNFTITNAGRLYYAKGSDLIRMDIPSDLFE
ncbi:hypothetical protein [Paenibacillus chungangensis]|uniref:Uncharacterized protein n=1 Tax=Paenibacillus chungangensis TaxID=696535 RepID=A0ABW3HU45_9BACL